MSGGVSAFEIAVTLMGLKEDVSCPDPSRSPRDSLSAGGEKGKSEET